MSSQSLNHSQASQTSNPNPDTKRRRRGDSKNDRQTPRYVCYCEKVYLSYPALYLHLKNKHPECFLNNRKIQTTKFKESITSDGYKILKMEKDVNEYRQSDVYGQQQAFKPKNVPFFPFQHFHPFPYSAPQNFMMPPVESKSIYMDNQLNNIQIPKNISQNISQSMLPYNHMSQHMQNSRNEIKPPSELFFRQQKKQTINILNVINLYIEETILEEQLQKREIKEMDLLFSLLPKCIREKSEILKALYKIEADKNFDLVKYTNLKYLESVLQYFKDIYVPEFVEKHKFFDEKKSKKEQKFLHTMLKLNRYFQDLDLAKKQLENFENWLINNNVIENVHSNVTFMHKK